MLLADRIIEHRVKDFGFVDGEVVTQKKTEEKAVLQWNPSPVLYRTTTQEISSIQVKDNEENPFIPKSILKTTKESPIKSRKCISFHSKVKVILVPSRSELRSISNQLYYSYDELEMSKRETFRELDSYRFSTECLERRDYLIKIGVFIDSIPRGVITGRSEQDQLDASDTESDSSDKMALNMANTPATSVECVEGDSVATYESVPDQTFRYTFNLSKFHKNECSVKVASIILYQPFMCFVNDVKGL